MFEIIQMGMIIMMLVVMTWMAFNIKNIYSLALITFGLSFVIPALNLLLGFLSRKELGLLLELFQNVKKTMGKPKQNKYEL